ncbi:MAG: DNA translocase FtsK [Terracidiphilus sp.]
MTVSALRQRIFGVSGRAAEGAGSAAGLLFHEAARCALDESHPACWKRVLTSSVDEQEWLACLYDSVVGPGLGRLQPSLADRGEDVLKLWRGMRQFVHWFCGLLGEAIDCGRLRYDGQREEWVGAESFFQAECEVEKVFFQPEWSGPVVVSGRLDQFVRSGPERWCAVEFKLGAGHPEADAAQVCLYHELLGGSGAAALVHFGNGPELEEILFERAAMEQARPPLTALIGALAGVSPAEQAGMTSEGPNLTGEWPRRPGDEETEMGRKLERALREYGAEAQLAGEPQVGPTFVRFLLEPYRGVTVSKIERRGAELQMRLGLAQEPIIHRVEGRIAVDVQRLKREIVSFGSLRAQLHSAATEGGAARVLAGVDLRGRLHFLDLARECPHVLVGGGTGSGKTEWLRAAVASLLVTHTPETLRLAVVDPKRNAFPELAGSPFLWRPDALIDSPDSAVLSLLEDLIEEMSRRNGLLKQAAADNLEQYRQKTGQTLPRVVMVVDEFAELLLAGGRKQRDQFEQGFIRIAAVGRAAGIHLILATQRPSRQVVSGNLKANLPGKIALRVSTRVDSGVLIDQPGAEHLLGRGDLLLAGLSSDPVRLQSAWLSEEERQLIFRADAS